jgi:hypothetical protein
MASQTKPRYPSNMYLSGALVQTPSTSTSGTNDDGLGKQSSFKDSELSQKIIHSKTCGAYERTQGSC